MLGPARKALVGLLCLSLPLAIAVQLRVHAASLPMSRRVAERLAIGEAKSAAMRDAAGRGLVGDTFLRSAFQRLRDLERSPQLDARARRLAGAFQTAFRDSAGVPNLIGTDPYRWLRRARNFAQRGGFGEERRAGREWNTLTGPHGLPADANLQAWALGLAGRVAMVTRGPSLEHMGFWSPVVVFALALIPAFLVSARLGGLVAGLMAAGTLALQPMLFQRTAAGYADTDSWNLLLSVLVLWLVVESIAAASDVASPDRAPRWSLRRRSWVLALLGGKVLGVFAWSWPGWWFYGLVLSGGLAASLLSELVLAAVSRARGSNRGPGTGRRSASAGVVAVVLLLFSAGTAGIALAIGGGSSLASLWREPLSAMGMLARAGVEAWPNPYVTVGELQPTSFAALQESAGGIELLIGGIAGIVIVLAAFGDPVRRTAGLVLLAWLAIAMVASTRGSRFLVMLGPPLAIGWGIFLATLLRWGWEGFRRHAPRRTRIATFACGLLLAVSSIVLMRVRDHQLAASEALIPEMNDAWAADFAWLRSHASPDAIVCAWWDFGDLVTAESGRRVLFDAGSQVSSTAYWVGRALAAEEPAQALGILRMLCLGDDLAAYQALRRSGHAPQRAVSILGEAARLPASERAAMLAATGTDSAASARVLAALEGEPPEAYLWITEDLTWKAHAWGRYGRWDFRKAAFYEATRGLSVRQALARGEELGIGAEEGTILLAEIERLTTPLAVTEWIAPGPVVSRPTACVAHPQGVVTERGSIVPGPQDWTGVMRSAGAAAAVYERAGRRWIVQIPAALSRSLYTRLMYEAPEGFDDFRLVHTGTSILGERSALYRIRWP